MLSGAPPADLRSRDCLTQRPLRTQNFLHICNTLTYTQRNDAQLTLSASDSAALVAFAGCATAGEAGGVTLKKFTSNAAKKCIVVEYILGSDGAKKDAVQAVGVCLRVCVCVCVFSCVCLRVCVCVTSLTRHLSPCLSPSLDTVSQV
jgi:hypothetical protein